MERVNIWEAINEYAVTCGGDPSINAYGNTPRMAAASRVEGALLRIKLDTLQKAENICMRRAKELREEMPGKPACITNSLGLAMRIRSLMEETV